MRTQSSVKSQRRRLIQLTIFTGGLVAVTIFTAFSLGLFGGRPLETASASSSVSVSSETAVSSPVSSAETTIAAATPTAAVIETDPAKLLIPIQSLPGYIPATAKADGSFSKTFAADNGNIN